MPNLLKRKIRLVTHDGSFHADEVFATACLKIYYKNIKNRRVKVIRTRNSKIIENADIVYDVGNIYDPKKKRFDHHQKDGAGKRGNGVMYSSFGLIWKHFGKELTQNDEIHEEIDQKLVQQICAADTAHNDFVIEGTGWKAWTFDGIIKNFHPDRSLGEKENNKVFDNMVDFFTDFLQNYIKNSKKKYAEYKIVESAYKNTEDKRIIVLEKGMSWKKPLVEAPEPLYVIYPTFDQDNFHIRAIPVSDDSVNNRKPFPKSWCGLRVEELQKESKIKGSIFVHNTGYLGVASNLESAILMAKKSIEIQ